MATLSSSSAVDWSLFERLGLEAPPMTVTCLWCPGFRFEGRADVAMAIGRQHREAKHPRQLKPRAGTRLLALAR